LLGSAQEDAGQVGFETVASLPARSRVAEVLVVKSETLLGRIERRDRRRRPAEDAVVGRRRVEVVRSPERRAAQANVILLEDGIGAFRSGGA